MLHGSFPALDLAAALGLQAARLGRLADEIGQQPPNTIMDSLGDIKFVCGAESNRMYPRSAQNFIDFEAVKQRNFMLQCNPTHVFRVSRQARSSIPCADYIAR